MIGRTAASWASSEATRRSMVGNRGRDTEPERRLRSALHARGLRFRVQYPALEGTRRRVDVAFTRARVAVEVRGCFWHVCPVHSTRPKANGEYWRAKLDANVVRDADTDARLSALGWHVEVVWEHEATDVAADRVADIVRSRVGQPRNRRGHVVTARPCGA